MKTKKFEDMTDGEFNYYWAKRAATVFLLFIVTIAGGCPFYSVWEQEMRGKAELSRAQQNRQIRIEEARAKLESAKLTSQAEIEEAKGAAEANTIMAESLGGTEGYLRWKYINMLSEKGDGKSVIYIPTEAGLPILEAGKR